MENIYITISILGICMLFIALILLLYGDGSREQKLMSYFVCGSLIQNVGYLLELTAPSMEAAVTAVKIEYLGSLFVPICYCWFMFIYCYDHAPENLLKILGIIDAFLMIIIFTCDHHSLYYRNLEWLVTESGHHYLSIEYGPAYLIFLICGCAIPYVLSFYTLFRAIITKSSYTADRQYKLILILSFLPVAALLAYSQKLTYAFDPTPAVLGLALSSVVILVWNRKIYDFSRLASGIVLNSMGDGVIALDDRKRIVSFNPAAAEIFTELNAHAIGTSIEDMDVFPEDISDENTNGKFHFNNHFYESHTKQIPDKTGKNQGYVILILDVTETRNYIEEIKKVREQAEAANMAKSEFLANMSHEIRTPMNAITGLSDLILEESRGQKVYSYACDVKSASQNLLAIINDILDLSKIEAGKMELVKTDYYLKPVVDEVVNMMDIAASQHGLLLKCRFDTTIPCRYHGDEGRMKQILINILNNAVKFTKEGYVKIFVGGKPGDTEDVEQLIFQIQDTGCGIRQEDLEKIFENFKQVDSKKNRSVEGTGLGLSITKRLVQMMSGSIEVESVYGEGTAFTITIPQKIVDKRTLSEVPEPPEKEEEQLRPFTANGCKILIVDDNLINRKVAVGFLKNYGCKLTEAASGPEAIELVRQTRFDIIFMDHMMPEMDGLEAVQIIRSECGDNGRHPAVIALTANAMEGVREKFLENGFEDFITKPLDRKSLHEVLLKWIPESCRTAQDTNGDSDGNFPKKDIGFDDIHIPGIHMEEAIRHHSGNAADFLELLNLYCIDGRRKLKLLRDLLEKNDYSTYEIETHGLKSASANIGAMELSAHAREHEQAAGRNDKEFILRHSQELLSSYEKQLTDIQKFLDTYQNSADTSQKENLSMDKETLIKETKGALDNLENFRSKECSHTIEKLLNCQLNDDVKTKLKEILEQLRVYEDDAAELLLHQLLDWLDKED